MKCFTLIEVGCFFYFCTRDRCRQYANCVRVFISLFSCHFKNKWIRFISNCLSDNCVFFILIFLFILIIFFFSSFIFLLLSVLPLLFTPSFEYFLIQFAWVPNARFNVLNDEQKCVWKRVNLSSPNLFSRT